MVGESAGEVLIFGPPSLAETLRPPLRDHLPSLTTQRTDDLDELLLACRRGARIILCPARRALSACAALREQRLTTPLIAIETEALPTRDAIAVMRAGASDLITSEDLDGPELARRLEPYLPRDGALGQRRIDQLLDIARSLIGAPDLTTVLQRQLAVLLELASAERGLILLCSGDSFVVGAVAGVSEDHAVLLASGHKGPVVEAERAGRATTFEVPAQIPGDDPVVWALAEAHLERGYLLPIPQVQARGPKGIAILGTPVAPQQPIPWVITRAAKAVGEALQLTEALALAREQERSASIRLHSQGLELVKALELAGALGEKEELQSLSRHLVESLVTLLKPDVVGVYIVSGRARVHDIHEAHPLPLRSVHDFEGWFNSRVTKLFGEDALKRESNGRVSRVHRLSQPGTSTSPKDPTQFDVFDWIPIPPAGPPIGAIALASTLDPGYGEAQRQLSRAVADIAAGAIRRQTETQDEKQSLVQSLLDGLPVGVALLDPYGHIVLANPTGRELLREAGTVSGAERVLELCGERFYDVTMGIEQTRRSFSRERRVGEKVFFVSIASVPLPSPLDAGEAPTTETDAYRASLPLMQNGYAVALRDVTEPHDIRQQLNQAEKLSTIGVMVSGVAHELNNPLTSIRGFSELLVERKDLPERVRDDLHRIQIASERCARIVRDLLSFARKSQLERPVEINLPGLLGEVFDLLFNQLRLAGVTLKRDFDRRVPSVYGDPHQLQQVFINLINNAQHAIEESATTGLITVRLRNADDAVHITFEDTGPGIRPEHQRRIFDPFFTTKSTKGTGLGLSICYGIVRDHGGEMRVESPPGCGARFIVELPGVAPLSGEFEAELVDAPDDELAEGEALEVAAAAEEDEAELRGQVLVVDNTPVVRRLVTDVLSGAGYAVDVAANAEEALATLKFMSYDVLLASLDLAGLGGQTLFHALQEKGDAHAERLVFMVDSQDRAGPRQAFLADPSSPPTLDKPFSHQALLQVVERVFTRARGGGA